MNAGYILPKVAPGRRGVSLLEVLISIGILAVGLTAALSLLPAGRTYMKKAAVDDRAAALVPNAYSTTLDLGLNTGSLTWVDQPTKSSSDSEGVTQMSDLRDKLASWQVKTTDSGTITTRHTTPFSPPPAQVTGTVSPPPAAGTSVDVVFTSGTITKRTSEAIDPATGSWKVNVGSLNLRDAPQLEIVTSGSNVGEVANQPYDDYAVTASYDAGGTTYTTSATPSSFRKYGQLRETDERRGRGTKVYSQTKAADRCGAAGDAQQVDVPRLTTTTSPLRSAIARSGTLVLDGTLWRVETGLRLGRYTRTYNFPNTFPQTGTPSVPDFGQLNPDGGLDGNDEGDDWVDTNLNPTDPSVAIDAEDWFVFEVEADRVITIEWTDTRNALVGVTDGDANKFPIWFNSASGSPMTPASQSGNVCRYASPGDGRIYTRAKLEASLATTTKPTTGWPGSHIYPYTLTVGISRSERLIAIDPLMATKLDKVLVLGNHTAMLDPYVLRRHRFAAIAQQLSDANKTVRPFVVPRLNWQRFASSAIDTNLAMAERIFRDEDNLAVDEPTNEDDAPTPRFDATSSGTPLRRQATGRMSWLFTLQPEDPGPVATNWQPGKYFEVSMVIYEDRRLPPADAAPALDGEYAFAGSWNDLDGLLSVTVPFDVDNDDVADLVGDDVRSLFKTGAWVLLAPLTNTSASPAVDQQRLAWIRIRTAQFENTGVGMQAKLLLETEPGTDVLLRSLKPATETIFPVWVIVHDGVVNVVTKTMQLE